MRSRNSAVKLGLEVDLEVRWSVVLLQEAAGARIALSDAESEIAFLVDLRHLE